MTEIAPQKPRADGARPVASLASISLARRRGAVTAAEKPGDLSPQLIPAASIAIAEELAELQRTYAAPLPPIVDWPEEELRASLPGAPQPFEDEPAIELAPRFAGEIMAYWEKLRQGRPFPAVEELDRDFVGSGWQDSMLVDFMGEPTMPRISRLGRPSGSMAYMPLMTDWILSRGRQAARRGVPLDEVQVFENDADGERLRFRVLILPLGTPNGGSDCVLCHLSRDN